MIDNKIKEKRKLDTIRSSIESVMRGAEIVGTNAKDLLLLLKKELSRYDENGKEIDNKEK